MLKKSGLACDPEAYCLAKDRHERRPPVELRHAGVLVPMAAPRDDADDGADLPPGVAKRREFVAVARREAGALWAGVVGRSPQFGGLMAPCPRRSRGCALGA